MRVVRTASNAILVLWLALFATISSAQDALKNEFDALVFVSHVMGMVGRGDLEKAYSTLKYHTVLADDEIDAGLQATKALRDDRFLAQYGKTVGHDFIGKEKLGQSVMRLVYVEKTQKKPLSWVFHLYLTDQGWMLGEIAWGGSPAALHVSK